MLSGGGEYVSSGGEAAAALVASDGSLEVARGGRAIGATIEAGGAETILAGGLASRTLLSGGLQYDYGHASNTVIRSGGRELVERLGIASGSVISNGGSEIVSSGAIAEATTVSAGGALLVVSGGLVTSGLTLEGGVATLSGTTAAGQIVRFAGASAELQLSNLAGFHAQISGMNAIGQKLDLGGFVYSSTETAVWSQTGTSGTLTITDGARKAVLDLIGTYVSSDFHLATDSAGGTFVDDPRTSPAAVRFAAAIAGFSGRDTGLATVHNGGMSLTNALPLATAATSGR